MFLRKKHSHKRQENESEDHDANKVIELKTALGPLSARSSKYCTDACLRRYLKARNWNVEKAKKMLEETLKWRSTYKPEEIRWPEVAHEGVTGKVFRANFRDLHGRTVPAHFWMILHVIWHCANSGKWCFVEMKLKSESSKDC